MRISDWSSDVCSSDLLAMAVDEAACPLITYDDFARLDVRVGTIVDAQPFPEARRPAIKLWVDLGPALGVRKTSAQIAVHYDPGHLVGKQVAAVVNFPPRPIGKFMSEVLVLGFPRSEEHKSELQSLMRISSAVY